MALRHACHDSYRLGSAAAPPRPVPRDRTGYAPERDLHLALRKDAGIDPGIIAWLLGQFPVEPLPIMLIPIDIAELRAFRDDLRERFRRLSVPPSTG